MGRLFTTSALLAALAGCWDQAQIQLDVTRDNATDNLVVKVCDEGGANCNPSDLENLFTNQETALKRRVSIFTSQPIVLVRLTPTSGPIVCVNVTIGSATLERPVALHDTGVDWCTSGCEPTVTCPP